MLIILYLLWVLKRTVSLSSYNLSMIWLDPHLYEKGSFMPTPFPLLKGVFSGAEGEGVLFFGTDPVGVGSWAELPTSSLEVLDIFYAHIT